MNEILQWIHCTCILCRMHVQWIHCRRVQFSCAPTPLRVWAPPTSVARYGSKDPKFHSPSGISKGGYGGGNGGREPRLSPIPQTKHKHFWLRHCALQKLKCFSFRGRKFAPLTTNSAHCASLRTQPTDYHYRLVLLHLPCGPLSHRLLSPKSRIEIGRNFPTVLGSGSPNFWLSFPLHLGFFLL